MNEREHEAHRDELASHLLGALEPGEAAALEQHLAGCEECRAELEWLRPAVLSLPEAVEAAEPPAGLRARIMGEIEADTDAKPERAATGFAWKRRSPGLRPLAGLAVIALLAAALAGYAIRDGDDGGSAATTVAVGKPPAVTAEMISEGDSAPCGSPTSTSCPPTRSCRHGFSAASGSNRRRRCSCLTPTVRQPR